MIFGHRGKARFLAAVEGFETAVRDRDAKRSQQRFREMYRTCGKAGNEEIAEGGPRLAALLPEVPDGPRGPAAMIVGACVERGRGLPGARRP